MRVDVDTGKCQGHARCSAVAPQVYELDDLGYVQPMEHQVAAGMAAAARAGAAACPERALTVVEPTPPPTRDASAVAPARPQEQA